MNGSSAGHSTKLVDVSLLVVRVIVGLIFFVHGAQKVFGAFGGHGLSATMAPPPDGMGPVLGFLVSIGECFGGVGIALGFLSRFSAAANIVIMFGAIGMVHGKNGFLLSDGGFEYNLALIGLLVPVLLLGPGSFSIGRWLPFPKRADGRPRLVFE
jgi:putative oxidoreductase